MQGTFFSPIAAVAQASLRQRRHLSSAAGVFAVAMLALVLAACAGPAQANTSPTASNQASIMEVTTVSEQDELAPQTAGANSTTSYRIKVYFSKLGDDFKVFPVYRFSPTLAVATFAIQSLIAGPTLSETDAGYYTELNSAFSGPSSCKGFRDFKLSLNKKGQQAEQGTATVQFCRPTLTAGVGVDGRILAQIQATLKQFSNIKKVVVLRQDGHCFGDESGMDICLKR